MGLPSFGQRLEGLLHQFTAALFVDKGLECWHAGTLQIVVDAIDFAVDAAFVNAVLLGVVQQRLGQRGLGGPSELRFMRAVVIGKGVSRPLQGIGVLDEILDRPLAIFERDLNAPFAPIRKGFGRLRHAHLP